MESYNILHVLDPVSLAEIFSYLSTTDVLLNLRLTCKAFYKIVSTSPYILKFLFENLIGRKIIGGYKSGLTLEKLQEIFKDLFISGIENEPLPFFGFRGNCGCDEDNYNFLFDKLFEYKENRSIVCTRIGTNLDIEGVLSEDYARETRQIDELVSVIDQSEIPHANLFKTWVRRYGFEPLEHFPLPQDNTIEEKMKPLRESRQELAHYLSSRTDKYNIELKCNKMNKSIGLIQSCHLNREIDNMTCPVKTLMAFASLNEEIGPSSIAALFNDCKTSDDMIKLLEENKRELPRINQTSIRRLADSCSSIEYVDEEDDGVEFVVFDSNGKKSDVIPLFWANFTKAVHRNMFFDFKECNFSGRYVMLKLIQCEDLMQEYGDNHEGTNIDIKFCCFYGPVIEL